MSGNRLHLFSLLCLTLCLATTAQAQTTSRKGNVPPGQNQTSVADLDGDGRADVVFCDINGDGVMDIVALSRSNTSLESLKSSLSNNGKTSLAELDIGDLDGDGRPEFALLDKTATLPTQATMIPVVRRISRILREGAIDGVDGLVAKGLVNPAATGGNPLSHIIGGPGGSTAGPPIPYPDPENPGNGGGTSGGGTAGGGSTIPISNGNDAGVGRDIIKKPIQGFPG